MRFFARLFSPAAAATNAAEGAAEEAPGELQNWICVEYEATPTL